MLCTTGADTSTGLRPGRVAVGSGQPLGRGVGLCPGCRSRHWRVIARSPPGTSSPVRGPAKGGAGNACFRGPRGDWTEDEFRDPVLGRTGRIGKDCGGRGPGPPPPHVWRTVTPHECSSMGTPLWNIPGWGHSLPPRGQMVAKVLTDGRCPNAQGQLVQKRWKSCAVALCS